MKTHPSVLFLFAALVLASCSGEQQPAADGGSTAEAAADSGQVRIVNVNALEIQPEPFSDYLNVIATVKASEDINLAAEANGRITQILVKRGARVAKGAPIAKVDDEMLKLEITRARAQAENAKENYDRRKRVWDSEKIGSELDLITAKTSWEQADAALKLLELQLDRTTLRAPFGAVVEEIIAEEGETVVTGTPIVRLISDGALRVRAGVPARYAESVKVGDPVEVSFEDYQGETVQSRVIFVGNSIDPQARTFNVESSLENRGNKYKIDMVANMRIKTRQLADVIVLNQEFVFRDENGYQVFVVGQDERGNSIAMSRRVQTGALFNNRVVITDGLQPGDMVITNGSGSVENQTRVRVVDTSNTSGVAAAN